MQPLTAPAAPTSPAPPRPGPRAVRGRWIWRLSGACTVIALGAFGALAVTRAARPDYGGPAFGAVPARTLTIAQAVTKVDVTSYGAPIWVAKGAVSQVTVREAISFGGPAAPAVTSSVSHGVLTLAAPSCARSDCMVGFTVTVPDSVAVNASSGGAEIGVSGATTADLDSAGAPVTASGIQGELTVTAGGGGITVNGAGSADLDSGGGPVSAAGIRGTLTVTAEGGGVRVHGAGATSIDSGGGPVDATGILGALTATADGGGITVDGAEGADLNSGGGPVSALAVSGPLTASTDGGGLTVDRLSGPLRADTGSGPVNAANLSSATTRLTTDSGGAWLSYSAVPRSVQVTTGGGPAVLELPGGPYAVTADSSGAPAQVSVPASPAATSAVSVNTDGGSLRIVPPGAGG